MKKHLRIRADKKVNSISGLGRASIISKGSNRSGGQYLVVKHQHYRSENHTFKKTLMIIFTY